MRSKRALRKIKKIIVKTINFPNYLKQYYSLIDQIWYAKKYHPKFSSKWIVVLHYTFIGFKKSYDPNPLFDSNWYQDSYVNQKINPLIHFLFKGIEKNFFPNPNFDPQYYLLTYPDVRLSKLNPLVHYLQNGFYELRTPQHNFWPHIFRPWIKWIEPQLKIDATPEIEKEVAVLIPVHNNFHLTQRCIESILLTKDQKLCKIFIVDDASTDKTKKLKDYFPLVEIIRLEENLGFTKACNQGFSHTKNFKYTFLLNNDTEVIEGFLTKSIELMKSSDDIGVVGSSLYYADGSIQEVGGIIWKDASGYNFGRNEETWRSQLNFSREVDYVSGAAILIRNNAVKTNLFDPQYSPAYYEDTDLAFALRSAGYRIMVSSGSKVIHFEGKSHGIDLNSNVKASQIVNQEKFKEKWATELADFPSADSNPKIVDRSAFKYCHSGNYILWLDDFAPDVTRDSGSVRASELLNIAKKYFDGIIFYATKEEYFTENYENFRNLGIPSFKTLEEAEEFIESVNGRVTHAWISRVSNALNYLGKVAEFFPESKLIFDTVDLHHLRLGREAEVLKSSELNQVATRVRLQEEFAMSHFDVTLVVSKFEKDLYAESEHLNKIKVVSNVHKLSSEIPDFTSTKGLFFIGGFLHSPNVQGITWFVKEIWPRIPENIKKDGLTIAGSNPTQEIYGLATDEIRVLGWIDNSIKELQKHRLSIAPLLTGAGVKGKVGESMASGVPVVGTRIALEGIIDSNNQCALIADTPEEFAEKIKEIYDNPEIWRTFQNLARDLIQSEFSIEAAEAELSRIFTEK